jgi:hypothetical protein
VKQRSVKDFENHHRTYLEESYMYEQNVVRIFCRHTDKAFREYLAWYQRITHIKLRERWTNDDYAEGGSSVNEDTTHDTRTREGSHVELGPVLDHVVCFLSTLYAFLEHCFFVLTY